MDLKGKVVVVTGSSRGLGTELTKKLKEEGSIVIAASRTEKKAKTDVTNEIEVNRLTQDTVKEYGKIDIWINNAGVWLPEAPVEESDLGRVIDMFKVNVFGLMYGSKAALKQMKEQESGLIVNILSTAALSGRPGLSGYAASKFAADGFTKSLREENKNGKVKIVSIFPGGMKTAFFDEKRPLNYNEFTDPAEVAEKIINNIKLDEPVEELVIKRN